MLKTSLCDLLEIEYPICLAGMGALGRATPPPLVAAVSNAGGLGVMGGSGLSPEYIRKSIREIKQLTSKPFGVDLLIPSSLAATEETRTAVRQQLRDNHPQHVEFARSLMAEFGLQDLYVDDEMVLSPKHMQAQVEVVLEEKVPVFAAGLGDPSWVVPLAHEQNMKVMGLAGTVRNAERQMKANVDIVVAQGYEAGGHTGSIANFALIPQVVDTVKPMPVVAAGAIADGRGVAAALSLGALGAWVGTAFLLADECDIPDTHKDQILAGTDRDFVITRAYTGKTARDYKNAVIEAWDNSGIDPLPMPLQRVLMEDFVYAAQEAGRFELTNNPAGQIGGMLTNRKPASQIMEELVEGASEALQHLQSFIPHSHER